MPCAVLEAGDAAGNKANLISVLMKLTLLKEERTDKKQIKNVRCNKYNEEN